MWSVSEQHIIISYNPNLWPSYFFFVLRNTQAFVALWYFHVAKPSALSCLSKFNLLPGWWWTEWGLFSQNHLCSAASYRSAVLVYDPVSNLERRPCFSVSSWGLHVAQVLAWEAVVGAGFRQPVVSRAGTTRRYQAGAPTPWQLFHN